MYAIQFQNRSTRNVKNKIVLNSRVSYDYSPTQKFKIYNCPCLLLP
jgi:hypothetical protein